MVVLVLVIINTVNADLLGARSALRFLSTFDHTTRASQDPKRFLEVSICDMTWRIMIKFSYNSIFKLPVFMLAGTV